MRRARAIFRAEDPVEMKGFLGEGTSFTGTLAVTGSLRIDGTVEGRVTTDGLLLVGPTGRLRVEELRARSLSVSGQVHGTLIIEERLEIKEGGWVAGEVNLPRPGLVVDPGGRFEGTVRMPDRDEEETPPADS